MFQTLRSHPLLVLSEVARDPLDVFVAMRDNMLARWEEKAAPYEADPAWEDHLRQLLSMPEGNNDEFWSLWQQVVDSLRSAGLSVGPLSFYHWNDGDAGFVRAIWTLIRHLKPTIVVETGVAHGMTSRFILEALARNRTGRLWSIDLPPVNPAIRQRVGVAVKIADPSPAGRWRYIPGTSRRRLPPLLSTLGHVDLFIHDSLHSTRNVTFELELAWRYLSPGGVIIVDDIDANSAFGMFAEAHPEHPSLVCTAEPLSPDTRRFNQKGLFGIICKR